MNNIKTYNNLSDTEKNAIREYKSWVKSDAPHKYRINMIESSYKILKILGIEKCI